MKKGSLLIVEDNAAERMAIEMAFAKIGVKENVYSVDDGEEAIAFLKRRGKYADCERYVFPTFLVTDLIMPRINGFQLLLFLKNSNFTIIPTIVFTMSDDPDDIKHAYLLGANAYQIKPVGMEAIFEKLRGIYEYWMDVAYPNIDDNGRLLPTDARGKLSKTLGHPVLLPGLNL